MPTPEPDEPRTAKPKPKDLSPMSVEALEEYRADLVAEIARVDHTIADRRKHRSEADRFFKG